MACKKSEPCDEHVPLASIDQAHRLLRILACRSDNSITGPVTSGVRFVLYAATPTSTNTLAAPFSDVGCQQIASKSPLSRRKNAQSAAQIAVFQSTLSTCLQSQIEDDGYPVR
jgi:hypothetical protein